MNDLSWYLMVWAAVTIPGVVLSWLWVFPKAGQPAWAAVTVTAAGKKVGAVDAVFRRKEYKAPYAEPAAAPSFGELAKGQRTSREDMLKAIDGFYVAFNAHQGQVPAGLADGCQWTANGQALGACAAPFVANSLQWLAGFRDRRVLAVDEARGLVAVEGFEDQPSVPRSFTGPYGTTMPNPTSYPRTLQVVEVFRFKDGRVEQIHVHRVAGERLQGQWRDELGATAGHDDAHLRAVFQESADQLGALVGGDAATHAENDALAIQPLHRLAFIQ